MRRIINSIRTEISNMFLRIYCMLRSMLCTCTGDLATNTIGAVIIAVVIVGLLITAINAFFPSFFNSMFKSMSDKLNANW